MRNRQGVFVGVFCIAALVVSVADGGKPEKKPKPPNPDDTSAECIFFTGDLQSVEGSTEIEGCCPNAGPSPEYTMYLDVPGIPPETYDGYLFINQFGTGPNAQYKVQFWTWDYESETPGTDDYFFQIYGGVLTRDRKAKTLTVTVDGESATGWIYYDGYPDNPAVEISIPDVSFVLFRTGNMSLCPTP